jgi:hypothetical protein
VVVVAVLVVVEVVVLEVVVVVGVAVVVVGGSDHDVGVIITSTILKVLRVQVLQVQTTTAITKRKHLPPTARKPLMNTRV